jgi:hypothetical protein
LKEIHLYFEEISAVIFRVGENAKLANRATKGKPLSNVGLGRSPVEPTGAKIMTSVDPQNGLICKSINMRGNKEKKQQSGTVATVPQPKS